MNSKVYGSERTSSNLRYCPGVLLEGLRKTTGIKSKYNRFKGRDSNPGTTDYEPLDSKVRLYCEMFV